MIPGSNLLRQAFRVIAKQQFTYEKFLSRSKGANGLLVPTYAPAVAKMGSVQPVPRTMYEAMGLDFQKNYFTVYVTMDMQDLARDVSGDRITWDCTTLQVESKTDWFKVDGWIGLLAVQVS
jgi:hypothetical protein